MNYHLSIKRWRDKINGNSYGSARLYGDGQLLHVIPFQYGQVSHFEWRTAEFLGSKLSLLRAIHDGGHTLTQDIAWVTKREAKSHGMP